MKIIHRLPLIALFFALSLSLVAKEPSTPAHPEEPGVVHRTKTGVSKAHGEEAHRAVSNHSKDRGEELLSSNPKLVELRTHIATELNSIQAELDLVLKGFHTLTQTVHHLHKQVSDKNLAQQQTLTQQLASLKARYAALQEKLEQERAINPLIKKAQEKFEAETQYRERREEELAFSPKELATLKAQPQHDQQYFFNFVDPMEAHYANLQKGFEAADHLAQQAAQNIQIAQHGGGTKGIWAARRANSIKEEIKQAKAQAQERIEAINGKINNYRDEAIQAGSQVPEINNFEAELVAFDTATDDASLKNAQEGFEKAFKEYHGVVEAFLVVAEVEGWGQVNAVFGDEDMDSPGESIGQEDKTIYNNIFSSKILNVLVEIETSVKEADNTINIDWKKAPSIEPIGLNFSQAENIVAIVARARAGTATAGDVTKFGADLGNFMTNFTEFLNKTTL